MIILGNAFVLAPFLLNCALILINGIPFSKEYKCNEGVSDIQFDRNWTGVFLIPLVTLEDQNRLSWYDEGGLQVLLKHVHTKFDKITVDLTRTNYVSSSHSILIEAAILNREIYREAPIIFNVIYDQLSIKNNISNLLQVFAVAHKANQIFPGTVNNIILENPPRSMSILRESVEYSGIKLGVFLDLELCLKYKLVNISNTFETILFQSSFEFTGEKSQLRRHHQELEKCSKYMSRVTQNVPLTFLLSTSDININFNVNYSRLVKYWTSMNNWAVNTNSSIIFGNAFDTPEFKPFDFQEPHQGWWRVKPNGSYEHPKQVIFQEKACLKDKLDEEQLIKNLNESWLQLEIKFDPKYISVVIDPFAFNKNWASNSCNSTCFEKFIRFLYFKGIRNIYIPPYPDSGYDLNLLDATLNSLVKAGSSFNNKRGAQIIHLNFLLKTKEIDGAVKVKQFDKLLPGSIKSIIYLYYSENGMVSKRPILVRTPLEYGLLKETKTLLNDTQIEAGILIKLYKCAGNHRIFRNALVSIKKFGYLHLIIGAKVNDEELDLSNSKRGASLLFEEFTASAAICKNNVLKLLNKSIPITFLTGWPNPDILENYFNFIKYWESVNEWAGMTKTNVIFSTAFGSFNGDGSWWNSDSQVKNNYIKEVELESKKSVFQKMIQYERERRKESTSISSTYHVFGVIIVGIVILLVFILVTVKVVHITFWGREILSKNERDKFFKKTAEANEEFKVENEPYDKEKYEMSKSQFSISKQLLGYGLYGKVVCGKLHNYNQDRNQVAIKVGTKIKTKSVLFGLLSEIKILAYLGEHENVVKLIGVCTNGLRRGNISVLLELCELGSLEGNLRKYWKDYDKSVKDIAIHVVSTNLLEKLLKWAYQIANGMDYISSKNIIHLDLATRNVLLTIKEDAKISDFSLSQHLSNNQIYATLTDSDALPWRWMAPECFNNLAFTTKSDVWAFGVVLWEIYSLGEIPYGGQNFDCEFITSLSSGLRLNSPLYKTPDIYLLMRECWNANPENRPTFSSLRIRLDKIMQRNKIKNLHVYDKL